MKKFFAFLGALAFVALIGASCGGGGPAPAGETATPAPAADEFEEGTCKICMTGAPCYDSPTTLSYCKARGGEWCNKKGECVKP